MALIYILSAVPNGLSRSKNGQIMLSVSDFYDVCTIVYVLCLKYGLKKRVVGNNQKVNKTAW